jgi:hypothetical protein
MKLLIIAPVHDFSGNGRNDAYVCDQGDPNLIIQNNISNIKRFNDRVNILFHVNKSFDRFDMNVSLIDDVYVSPYRFDVSHGKSQLASLLITYKHALDAGIDFDYVTITHSGEMFVKEGALDYMQQSEFSAWFPPGNLPTLIGWKPYDMMRRYLRNGEDLFCNLFDAQDYRNYGASFVEGSFYTKDLFTKMYNWFDYNYDIENLNSLNFVAEELMLSTIAYHLSETKSPSTPINAIFLNNGHNTLSDMKWVNAIRNNENIVCLSANQFGGDREIDSTNIYTVKRINRTTTDPVRIAISQL